MGLSRQELADMLNLEQFPLSAKYDPEWVVANEMGPNALWLTEALCQVMELKPAMRVLDMGCGTAMSSIFLAREYGVQVWANDLWIPAADNAKRIREAGMADRVFPMNAEARSLPYADRFFDAIVSLDSYHYYGTDVHYLEFHMLKLLKPGSQIGIISPASPQELPHPRPDHLSGQWYWLNSIDWWRRHWQRYPEIEVQLAELLPGGWEMWVHWHECLQAWGRQNRPEELVEEYPQIRADGGQHLGFVRMVGRRRTT